MIPRSHRARFRGGFMAAAIGALLLAWLPKAAAFSYLFADTQGPLTIAHPKGYTGTGGNLVITIGIDPASLFASEMMIPTGNAISIWNGLVPTTGNLLTFGGEAAFDFESALLHELGHALGLEHPNLGSESGFVDSRTELTRSQRGTNGLYNTSFGPDSIPGSSDDSRVDDLNVNWFQRGSNNPFSLPTTVDSTTYSVLLADLPATHTFSVNASRQVAAITGGVPANSEAVMQQGTFLNEAQRTLGHDDVAGIRYARTGLDELSGTSDDYTLKLVFTGLNSSADVTVGFDSKKTSFAVTDYTATRIGQTDHLTLGSAQISFSPQQPWHFNQTPIPEPGVVSLLGAAIALLLSRRSSKTEPKPRRKTGPVSKFTDDSKNGSAEAQLESDPCLTVRVRRQPALPPALAGCQRALTF